jgi:hypothetical protein
VRATFFFLCFVAFSNHAIAADAPSKPEPGDPGAPEREAPPPETSDRALAGAAAVVPGVVVHGMGHYAAGETTTGNRLLLAEGVGLGLVLGAGYSIVATGASRYVVGPAAATVIFGVGLFGMSFLADVYGSVSPDAAAAGRRTRAPAWAETELGYRHISDPIFAYEDFLVESVSIRSGRLRLTPSGWFSLDADNARYRVEGAYRFLGKTPTVADRPTMNDHLDAVVGMVHHRYATERFTRSSMGLAVDTRYDLGHVGRTLRGAFVEAGAGYSFARIDYDVQGIEVPTDFDDVLLARFGFGAVFRGKSNPGSEARVYYDHRHDDFAGGLIMEGLGSGVAGHFGIEARWFFTPELGLGAQAEVGSAFVTGLSVLFRQAGAGLGGDERGAN